MQRIRVGLSLTQTVCRMPTVHVLDYVAGNVRSLANAIEKLGYTIKWVKSPSEIADAEVSQVTETMHLTSACSRAF